MSLAAPIEHAAALPPPLRFTYDDGERAYNAWGCNCGPTALAGMLGLTLDEVRPHLGDFETKGYTNPTLMKAALLSIGARFRWKTLRMVDSVHAELQGPAFPSFGLARVQWGGPWTKPGVPAAARYRATHWVGAMRLHIPARGLGLELGIFDVNALVNGSGWTAFSDWAGIVAPLLTAETPRADGSWWVTHAVEVER